MATAGSSRTPKGTKSQKLEDQAATAALYVTGNQRKDKKADILDADGKLSSASAATSLKYAKAQDLPSYPIVGINQDSSAGAAASLAAANQKPFEHWKPEHSAPANKAAYLAKDYKMDPLWQPEASAAGSKAALLAARNSTGVNLWKPGDMPEGYSAADQAMRTKGLAPEVDYGYTKDGSNRALVAATGAMSGKHRPVHAPAEPLYPDAANSAANALKAATKAHKPGTQTAAPPPTDLPGLSPEDATRIHNAAVTNMSKEMYTSHPPVAPEVEERNREAGLRAAAITMANAIYAKEEQARKNRGTNVGLQAATSATGRTTEHDVEVKKQAQSYLGLQEAAQKLASERLAKLRDENAEYRSYYGTDNTPKSRLSVRGRRRSNSDSESDDDKKHSQKIRSQMSGLNKQLAEVDSKKRQQDRNSLLEAARRNVDKSMKGMDEQVFQQTGKPSPAMEAEWDRKARAKAEAESSNRLQNHGKVNIGGGRYMDQSEIDAIAASRVQPTLDEVTHNAEEKRAREEERRQAIEEARRLRAEKEAYEKERDVKTKETWKQFKAEEKDEAKAKKEADKAEKEAERKRREEQLRELNEKDIERPSEKDKRKSRPFSFAGVFGSKRKSSQPERSASNTSPTAVGTAVGTTAQDDRRSSTSLESSASGTEGAAVATDSNESKDKGKEPEETGQEDKDETAQAVKTDSSESVPAAGTDTATKIPDPPKHDKPVQNRIAIHTGPGTTETTVTGGVKKEDQSDKEQGKKSSWFKRISRRSSKPSKSDEKSLRDSKTSGTLKKDNKDKEVPKKDGTDSTIVTEPVTGLPMDTSKENPAGFGTDHIPHIEPAPTTTDNAGEGPSTSSTNAEPALTSATINPALESVISPVEADAAQAKETFDEDGKISHPEHMPTAPDSKVGEFLPTKLQPTGGHIGLNDSERDVALAGKTVPPRSPSPSLSSLSSDEPTTSGRGRPDLNKEMTNDSEDFQEAQDTLNTADLPMPPFAKARASGESPHRETRFREEL